jgi:hypothetical protein
MNEPTNSDAKVFTVHRFSTGFLERLSRPSSDLGTVAMIGPQPSAEKGGGLHLRDFAHLDDNAFVEAAYWLALKRGADPTGKSFYLERLRGGASRAEILGRLRYSPEGRSTGARIGGLAFAYRADRMTRWPIFGGVFSFVSALAGLSGIRREIRVASNRLSRVALHASAQGDESKRAFTDQLGRFDNSLAQIAEALNDRARNSDLAKLQESVGKLRDEVHSLRSSKADRDDLASQLRARPTLADIGALESGLAEAHAATASLRDSKVDRDELASRLRGRPTFVDVGVLETRLAEATAAITRFGETKVNRDDLTSQLRVRPTFVDIEILESGLAEAHAAIASLREFKTDRDDLASEIAARPTTADVEALKSELSNLNMALASLRASKADHARFEQVESDLQRAVLRAVDDVNGTFRLLLGAKADGAEIAQARAGFEKSLQDRWDAVFQLVQSMDARKADAAAIESVRNELLTTLHAGVDGLTQSISNLAASKVDRGTVTSLIAEIREGILERFLEIIERRQQGGHVNGETAPDPDGRSVAEALREAMIALDRKARDLTRTLQECERCIGAFEGVEAPSGAAGAVVSRAEAVKALPAGALSKRARTKRRVR